MKINWGTGIVIAFVAFISFILFFIITMSTNKKYTHDLVTKDYYGKELEFQGDIDKENNAKKLKSNITWKKTSEGLLIQFPKDLNFQKISGKVFLYRPSNKKLDFNTQISLTSSSLIIPNNRMLDGRWNIIVDWKYNNTDYMYKKDILF